MKRRILALTAGQAILAAGALWVLDHQASLTALPGLGEFALATAVLAALGLLPRVHVELRRHASWITASDCALLVALFALGPVGFVAATTLADVPSAVKRHQDWLKSLFNIVHGFGGVVAAALVFTLLGRTAPLDPTAWAAGVAALATIALWDALFTAAVLAIAEEQPYLAMVREFAAPALATLVASSLLGIAALILFHVTPFGPLLFAPVLGILIISTRSVSHQRAERQHFERLYAASSNLARLVGLRDMLGMVATEARGLVTGASAICCTIGPDGTWTGVFVSDHGQEDASDAVLAAVVALAGADDRGEVAAGHVSRPMRRDLPPFLSMVWAQKQAEPVGRVVLAVLRELPSDEQEGHRSDVLAAFVAHAATVVANVGLHEAVQDALERQVELNRQKGEFVAVVSHELRTPLASMMGAVQTLQRLGDRLSDADRARLLQMSSSQGTRLRSLIEDLLLVAAADHQEVTAASEPIDVGPLCTSLGAELTAAVGARLRVDAAPGTGVVMADADILRRILGNLIENARKYAEEGTITLSVRREGAHIVFAVSDEGPGIPPQDRERVFERFVQLDQSTTRRQGGTGLGLYLCRQLATLLDGTLTLREAPSGGAEFVLRLAASDSVPRPARGKVPGRGPGSVHERPAAFTAADHERGAPAPADDVTASAVALPATTPAQGASR